MQSQRHIPILICPILLILPLSNWKTSVVQNTMLQR
ncbi:hypothetical protein EVD33_11615 [Bacteroidales bacterium SW292]|nr:hypothetical protein [Bacteroidales bacterium SW292]